MKYIKKNRTGFTLVINEGELTAWKTSNDARTIGRAVRGRMSEILDQGVDALDLRENQSIYVALKTGTANRKQYIASANGRSIALTAALNPMQNPLLDPALRERLRNMKPLMGEIVIGQQETLNEIGDAIIAHFGSSRPTRPLSAYLIGVSGNGKTETGRGQAQVYKDSKLVHTERLDVTKIAPEKILLNQDSAKLTAFHEAGHTVANQEEITRRVTMVGKGDAFASFLLSLARRIPHTNRSSISVMCPCRHMSVRGFTALHCRTSRRLP